MRRFLAAAIALSVSATCLLAAQEAATAAPPPGPGMVWVTGIAPAGGFDPDEPGPFMRGGGWLALELRDLPGLLGERPLGELSAADLAAVGERLSLAAARNAYVSGAAGASLILPGSGQFSTGRAGAGTVFLLAELALAGGSLAAAWFLMPADLRPGSLDYLGAPLSSIEAAWKAHSLADYLPWMGAMAAAGFLDLHLRVYSAGDAARGARELVDAGKARLEARVGPGMLGMRMRF